MIFNYTQVEAIKADYQSRIDELQSEIAFRDAMDAKRLELWRGECGHHWIKSEIDQCPICKVKTIAAAYETDSTLLLDYELESISSFLSF